MEVTKNTVKFDDIQPGDLIEVRLSGRPPLEDVTPIRVVRKELFGGHPVTIYTDTTERRIGHLDGYSHYTKIEESHYEYEETVTSGRPDVSISLTYADAYDILLDGIQNEASIEPLAPHTFKALAENLLGLLIDANEVDQ